MSRKSIDLRLFFLYLSYAETASLAFTKTYTKPPYTIVRVQTKVLHCNLFLLQHITTAIAVGWLVNLLPANG